LISKAECKDRHLYRIHSRNLVLGVFRASSGGFIGIREKAGNRYLFEEYHWDKGPPHGTVRPEEELSEVFPPDLVLSESHGSFCATCEKQCDYILWPEGGSREVETDCGKFRVPGQWQHLEPSDCSKLRPQYRQNTQLFDWLQEMGAKHVHAEKKE
jgi:hypothetical protein